jgi:hypothetical protein
MITAAAQIGQMTFFKWMTPVWSLPWFVWILFVRRYFPKSSTAVGANV